MKKLTLTLASVVMLFSGSFGQMRPEAGDIGIGFHVSGLANVAIFNWPQANTGGMVIADPLNILTPGTTIGQLVPQNFLFGRYYLSSNLALRASLGINSTVQNTHSVDSAFGGVITDDSKTTAFSWGIGAGIENHFATSATRLDPYAGAMFQINMVGGIQNEMTSDFSNASDPSLDTQTRVNTNYKGGGAWNFDLIGGFNYFFSDYIAIGAEVTWGFSSMGVGGDYTQESEVTAGGTTTTGSDAGSEKTTSSGFRVGSTSGVNLSIFW